jgi:hypothetical protein
VTLGGWNIYRWVLLPQRGAPLLVDTREVSAFVPASRVQQYPKKLVVTVAAGWDTLTPMERRERLVGLAAWAKAKLEIDEVIVADSKPTLLARVVAGRVILYGPRS